MKKLLLSGIFISCQTFALTAEKFVMNMQIPTVGAMINFNSKDDPNNQLGGPNQYSEKTSWADTQIDLHDLLEENFDEINNTYSKKVCFYYV